MAKAAKITKFVLISLLCLGLIGYVVFAMIKMHQPDPEARCADVQLVVKKNPSARFIDEKEIEDMLRNAGLYPKGELMTTVDTKKIEDLIRSNDFISKVECYKTSNNKLCITVEQRTPIIYILPDGRDGYFVDAQGKILKKNNYVANLITATGDIDPKFARTSLVELAQFIEDDEFWNSQIEQIYVSRDKHRRHVLELVPRVGDHIVYLGSIDNYEKKFSHLKEFYEKALSSVGWNKYARIDLQYDNQVICTKKGKSSSAEAGNKKE